MTRILQSDNAPADSGGRSEWSTLDLLKYVKNHLASMIFRTDSGDTKRTMIEEGSSGRIGSAPITAARGLTTHGPAMSCRLRVGSKALSMNIILEMHETRNVELPSFNSTII